MTTAPVDCHAPIETSTPTVLVVDDSSVDLHLTQKIIESHLHWNVTTAGNGAEALGLIYRSPPSLVVTDLVMPEIDGLELVRTIKRDLPLIPVVLMTAYGSEEMALKALQIGAASYVPKKTLEQDLPDTLDRTL